MSGAGGNLTMADIERIGTIFIELPRRLFNGELTHHQACTLARHTIRELDLRYRRLPEPCFSDLQSEHLLSFAIMLARGELPPGPARLLAWMILSENFGRAIEHPDGKGNYYPTISYRIVLDEVFE